jgi:hypothetical protein
MNTLAYYDTELITEIKSLIVQALALSPFMFDIMTNTLAYYDTELIMTVKCFTIQNPAIISFYARYYDKHPSLIKYEINNGCKRFYSTGLGMISF